MNFPFASCRIGGAMALGLLLAACGGGGSAEVARTPAGVTALASATPEVSGDCAAGALRVRIGFDGNGNGTLEGPEVSYTELVCTAGAAPTATLTNVVAESAGAQCPAGGQRVMVGPDANADGVLQAAEAIASAYLCNGRDGATGPQGPQGPAGADGASGANGVDGSNGTDGTNGTNGTNGSDGANSLLSLSAEPAGARCPAGGTRVESGWDIDRDGTLAAGEVTQTAYICTGANGSNGSTGSNGPAGPAGIATLLLLEPEPAGSNCAAGGTRVRSGPDSNGNAVLDGAEVTRTAFVCNGRDATAAAEWDAPQLLATGDNAGRRVAAAADGTLFVAWIELVSSTENVLKARRFIPGAGWSLPVTVAAPGMRIVRPDLVAAGNGQAFLSWLNFDGTTYELAVSRHVPGSGWEAPYLPGGSTEIGRTGARMAMNAAGEAILVMRTPGLQAIQARRFHPATGWGAATPIATRRVPARPCLDANGVAQVVWIEDAASGMNTWARQGAADGSWGAPQLLDHIPGLAVFTSLSMACNAGGHAVFAWQPPLGHAIRAMRYAPGTGWEAAVELEPEPGGRATEEPAVAVDNAGNSIVLWTRAGRATGPLYARYAPAGGAWQPRAELPGTATFNNPTAEFSIAFDPQGQAHASWTLDGHTILSRFDAGSGWAEPTTLDVSGHQDPAVLAFDPAGRGVAVWPARWSATEAGVRVSRYR